MKNKSIPYPGKIAFIFLVVFVSFHIPWTPARAQTVSSSSGLTPTPSRITQPVDNQNVVQLTHNVHPKAQPRYDQGSVPPSMEMPYVTLLIRPSVEQETMLKKLLDEQQDRSSSNYHKWLTSEQYADRFGLTPEDMNKIVGWLENRGLRIEYVANARNWVSFSGTADQVGRAFHTQIHQYNVDGEIHFANATPPSIPAAFSNTVSGILGLTDFHPKPLGIAAPPGSSWTGYALTPADIATIYNIKPLYNVNPPIDGTGQTIVVVGQSDINLVDIAEFRNAFGLSHKDPQEKLFGGDPGVNEAQSEADLDLEWAGAIAKNATIYYVYGTDVWYAVLYTVDHPSAVNNPSVLSMSYGYCEPWWVENYLIGPSPTFIESLAQEANSEGITWVAASGDAGAAGCDPHGDPTHPLATGGPAVLVPASMPEVTAVGGTEFLGDDANNGGNPAIYWGSDGSALGYIPERAWNDSFLSPSIGLAAGGGGISTLFPKPSWQISAGVLPNSSYRVVPDLALTASWYHDPYLICYNGGCANGEFSLNGGTSASTPVFAGIVALLNQFLDNMDQGPSGLGNINQQLYQLSTTNSFTDITTGNNAVQCDPSDQDCPTGVLGFSATSGYDQATGWGSVNAYNLVVEFSPRPPKLQAPLDGTTYTAGTTSANLQWSQVLGATGYNVQIFTGSCGGTSFPGTTTGPSVTNWNVSGLSDGQTYYWQVQTVLSSTTSPYSDCYSFSISNPSSSVPVLLAPGSTSPPGPVIPTTTPTFQWNPVPGVDAYALYISQYPYGTGNLVYQNQAISGSANNFPIPAGTLNFGTSYRWNMQAHTTAGWSGLSGLLYFSVASSSNSISGYVTLSGNGLGGVAMALGGSSIATATTSASGYYSFPNLTQGGNYTVTPSLGGYTFTPTSTPFNNLSGNQTGNFTATASGVSYTVTTNPAGLQVVVDGTAYSSSQSFAWTPGSIHVITASSPQSGGTGTRYVFYSWSDGGSQTHTITIPSSSATYVATFNTQYQLTTSVSPSGTGTISPDCSSGCWNNSGANVSLLGTPISGYTFSSWSGSSNSNSNPLPLTINSPQSLICTFTQGSPSHIPTITTLPATSVYTTSAILNGTVNPNGSQTNAWFEYDTTPNLTTSSPQTPQQNIGSDNSVHNIFAQVFPLTPGLTYFFRVAAISVGGTVVYSTPLSFLTASTNYTLQVGVQGTGSGAVTSSPSGINCPSTCQASLANGSSVTLTATPSGGSTFAGWNGACNGTASCSLTMSRNQTVYATFTLLGPPPTGGVVTFTPGTISTVAGSGTAGFLGDGGPATSAELNIPSGVSVDGEGNLYIADTANNRVRVVNKQLSAITVAGVTIQPGAITTVAGNGTAGYSGDNGSATQAELNQPFGLALDSAGDIFIADSSNVRIREVSTSGTITTVAGNGVAGSTGDGGPATSAEFYSPRGIGLDSASNLYIADFSANRVRVVNRQSTAITVCGVTVQPGNIATIAGNGTAGYGGDGGQATVGELNGPSGVAVDGSGNVYIADHYNNYVRKVNAATGTITTAAGSGTPPYNNYFWGDGGLATQAQLWLPGGVAVDAAGDILISDTNNNRIRRVSSLTGIIATLAGSGPLANNYGYTGDGGPATSAEMNYPSSAEIDTEGNIYIADSRNHVVRAVSATAAPLSFSQTNVGQTSAAQDVTVSNVGTQNLAISQIAPSSGFDTNGADTTCTSTTTLSPGGSCILGIRFAPAQVGSVAGSVTITDSAATSPQTISLSGTGVAPNATLSVLGLSFGVQAIGITSAPQTLTVTNNGTAPLSFSSFVATGDFAVAGSGSTCSTSSSLAVNTSCTIAVTFAPSASGPLSSSLSIADNAAGSPQAVVLTGVGTAASLSPSSLTFTGQTVGTASPPQVVTLTNLGSGPMNIWQIPFVGPNASDFSRITTCNSTLGAGNSCTISVTFTPGAAGTRTASLLVSDDGGGSPQGVALTGTGVASASPGSSQTTSGATGTSTTIIFTNTTPSSPSSGPAGGARATAASNGLSASALSFGEQEVGTSSAPQSVVVINTEKTPLTIGKIEVSGSGHGDFELTNTCGASLEEGKSCTLRVTFKPHESGARKAMITIEEDAPGGPQHVRLEGVGVLPEGGRQGHDSR